MTTARKNPEPQAQQTAQAQQQTQTQGQEQQNGQGQQQRYDGRVPINRPTIERCLKMAVFFGLLKEDDGCTELIGKGGWAEISQKTIDWAFSGEIGDLVLDVRTIKTILLQAFGFTPFKIKTAANWKAKRLANREKFRVGMD